MIELRQTVPTKQPWESKETVIGIIGLLLPWILGGIFQATGIELDMTADQIYTAIVFFYALVISGLVVIRNVWTQAKISLH